MNRPRARARATPLIITPVRAGAVIEIATGVALVAAPSVVFDALIGSFTGDASVVGRVLGGGPARARHRWRSDGPARAGARDPGRVRRLQRIDGGDARLGGCRGL